MSRDWLGFNPGRIAILVDPGYFFAPFYNKARPGNNPGSFLGVKGGICGSLHTLNGNGCGWNSQDCCSQDIVKYEAYCLHYMYLQATHLAPA